MSSSRPIKTPNPPLTQNHLFSSSVSLHFQLSCLLFIPIAMATEQLPADGQNMASERAAVVKIPLPISRYSERVVLKSIFSRGDGGVGLVGERMVIGGWVKSSREVKKDPLPAPAAVQASDAVSPKDVSCVEVIQSRIPFFRSIIKVFGGGDYRSQEKLESVIRKPPPSIAVLQISDGSCVPSLLVTVDSSLYSPSDVMPTGTCILVEGILEQPIVQGKHAFQLKTEKILHIGAVDQDTYPLSKKRVLLESLRDCSHLRPRTTTVASVMRIRNSLSQATHAFLQNHGFLLVQVPIITSTDFELNQKFTVTTYFGKENKTEESNMKDDKEHISLAAIKASIREKSRQVEELKRTDSNREALLAAQQDLKKANMLALQLESREKSKSRTSVKADEAIKFSDDFFARQTYLTASGRFHLESFALALGNVYSFGPRFSAEKLDFKRSLAEMWMVELEIAFSQMEDAMNCAYDLLKFLSQWLLENCHEDLSFVTKRIDKTIVDRLQLLASSGFEKISYAEAIEVLRQVKDKKFERKIEQGVSLTDEHERYLAEEIFNRPVIICNYPKEIKPFYVRLDDSRKTVAAFDVIIPKVGTLISGSQNEERLDMLDARIEELGLPKEQYGWYLDLRRHGTVKHSGFSFALDLMVLYATGLNDIRDAVPFPRSRGEAYN